MRRRKFLAAVAVAPAIAAPAFAQQPVTPAAPAAIPPAPSAPAPQQAPPAAVEAVRLEPMPHDAAGAMVTQFFTGTELATLRRLADVLLPPLNGMPGALEAHAPEFLDFLIGHSPVDRQTIYRKGLGLLEQQANQQFKTPFAQLETAQVETLMAPLRQPWTFIPPIEPVARLLREAKADVRTATFNSREYLSPGSGAGGSGAGAAQSGRRGGGMGQYVYTLE